MRKIRLPRVWNEMTCRITDSASQKKTKPTMGVLDNWQVKDALVSKVSVDARGYNQFTVGDVSADTH